MIPQRTRYRRPLLRSIATLIAITAPLHATELFWDGQAAGPAVAPADGGTGTWTDGVNNWLTAAGVAQPWSNLTPDSAVLGGTAGTVTLGGPIVANQVRIDTTGYTLQGSTLTLTGNSVLTTGYAATGNTNIQTALSGTNLVINPLVTDSTLGLRGQGNLTIRTNTAHTGTLTISNGVVEIAAGVSLASSTAGIVVNGSGLYHPSSVTTHPFWQTRLGMLRLIGTGDAIGAQTVTLNGGTVMRVSTAGGNDTATIQNLALNSGDNMIVSAPNGASGGDVLIINNLTRTPAATMQFRSSYGTLGAAGDNGSIRLVNVDGVPVANTNGILGGWAYANSVAANTQGNAQSSSFAAWSAALNSVVPATPDKATGAAGGVLNNEAISAALPTDNFLNNSNNTLTTSLTLNSLIAQNDLHVNGSSTLTLASGGLIYRGGNFWIQSSENNGKITSGEAAGKLFLNVANTIDAAGDYRLRLQIVDNGATPVQLVKSGNGSIRIGTYNNGSSSGNSYTGGTIVQAGRILADAANAFGTGPVTVQPGGSVLFSVGGTFTNNFTLSGLGAPENSGLLGALRFTGNAEVSGAVTLAGPTRINAFASNDTGRITGPITGAFDLEKTGAGTITVSNVNSDYTGDVLVNAGTLAAQGSSAGTNTSLGLNSPTRKITVNSGATLSFLQNNIFGGGGKNAGQLPTVTVNGGTFSSTRFNVVGNVNLNGGTMTQATTDSGSYLGFQFLGTVNVGGTAPSVIQSTNGTDNHLLGNAVTTFEVANVTSNSAADLTVSNGLRDGSGDYPGAGALAKTGEGTLVLAGVNGYTDGTNVDAGILLLNGSLTGASFASVSAGATLGGTGSTNGGVLVEAGASLLGGDGILPAGQLTLGGSLTLEDNSLIALTLGAGGAHSSLARAGGGTWSFDLEQKFRFLDAGMEIGTYDNIISGLEIDPLVAAWTIVTPGISGTFSYDGAGGVDLNLTAVPEPSAAISLLGGIAALLGVQRRRRA